MSTGAAELLQDTGGTVTDEGGTGTREIAARSPFALFWRRLRQDKVALVALGFIILLILVAILAPLIVKIFGAHPPNEQNSNALDSFGSAAGPSSKYLMGTDGLGRDVFSRTLYGARDLAAGRVPRHRADPAHRRDAGHDRRLLPRRGRHLPVALDGRRAGVPGAAARARPRRRLLAEGLPVGERRSAATWSSPAWSSSSRRVAFAAVRRGGLKSVTGADWALRLAPGGVILFMGLILLVGLSSNATLIQPGLPVVIFVIALAGWPYMARIIRGQVLSLREKEFVEAARSLGASDSRIIFRHILPNLVAPIIVYTTLLIPTNILFEAALSFLGVGVQPPTASWGAMIADAIEIFDTAWWYMTFPGVALLLTVLAFNLVGDGLQDALNPRTGR